MAKKKAKKALAKKKQKKAKPSTEVVIRVEAPQPLAPLSAKDIDSPEKEGRKYMIPNTWMSERQVVRIVQKTPPQHIYRRKGKGGQVFDYVTGHYVTKILNFVFGWNWDFEVVTHGKEGDQVWVQGKLTVKDDKGHLIVKSQFGRADIKYKKDQTHKPENMVDFGNDLKAAATDSLKKCASLLGVASDVYGREEASSVDKPVVVDSDSAPKETKQIEAPKVSATITPKTAAKTDQILRCQECATPVTEQVARYSQQAFGKILCRDHQPNKRK